MSYGNYNPTRGMTLTEVLVVVAISTMLMLGIMAAITQFYQFNGHLIAQRQAIAEAEIGMNRLVRDLRTMSFAFDGTYPLQARSTSSIAFFVDTTGNRVPDLVRYELRGDQLERDMHFATGSPPVIDMATPDATQLVARSVQNQALGTPLFSYTDHSGTPVPEGGSIANIAYITLHLLVNVDPNRIAQPTELRSSAAPRNLQIIE